MPDHTVPGIAREAATEPLRLDRLDTLGFALRRVAARLDDRHEAQPVRLTYAAEGSIVHLAIIPQRVFYWLGGGPEREGVDPPDGDRQQSYWCVESWRLACGWLADRQFHAPDYLADRWTINPVDAAALAVVINRLEQARGAEMPWLEDAIDQWYERLAGRSDFDPRPPRLPDAWWRP